MVNIEILETEGKDEIPFSLDWRAEITNKPAMGVRVFDGLGMEVATCARPDLAEFIVQAGNNFAECRDALTEAREMLLYVMAGKATMADLVDTVSSIEITIAAAGGTY
ncbi:MAG: hypothetical protein ABIW76_13180 [Fibrobacteria bacterium]